MNNIPQVSVLMSVYNTKEKFLREAIESILNQTYTDFELLILNDCSTDPNVEKVVLSYNDERIKYSINEQNLGISGSRNKLVALSRGQYLAIMDHDDISLPTRLAQQVEFLNNHPDIGVLGTFGKEIISGKKLSQPTDDQDIKLSLMYRNSIYHSSCMLRRELFDLVRYETKFTPAEDYALWCRLIKHTKFHNMPEVLFSYRNHHGNTSHKQKRRTAEASQNIRIFSQLDNPELYIAAKEKSTATTRIKLFDILPILTLYQQSNRTTCKLFNLIPIYTSKTKTIV